MTETVVQYGQPTVDYPKIPSDARWLIYLALDIEAMDGILADLAEEWAAKFADHFEASQMASVVKEALEAVENSLRADTALEAQVTAKSAGEREKQRKAIIETNPVWLECNEELREAASEKGRLELELEALDKCMGVMKARLAWRGRTVALLTSMPRMETEQLPTVEHPLPEAMDNRQQLGEMHSTMDGVLTGFAEAITTGLKEAMAKSDEDVPWVAL